MTPITQNLPWFVKGLGVSIIGKECYASLVENLNVDDVKCLKYSLSKGLGLGIVVGGSIVKVPQILLITSAKSARGLSLEAYVLETLSYAITFTYAVRHSFPFSTYGENLFLTIQNTLITLLIIVYAPTPRSPKSSIPKSQTIATALVGLALGAIGLFVVPNNILQLLQLTTIPLSLFSKIPQIRQNSKAQSTGQLSAFAVVSQIVGCLARLFTTAQEVGDNLVLAGFALALLLNAVLGAQLWMYWGKADATVIDTPSHAATEKTEQEKAAAISPEHSATGAMLHAPVAIARAIATPETPQRVNTPPPRTPSSAGGRKWARKVD